MVLIIEDGTGIAGADSYNTTLVIDNYNLAHKVDATWIALGDPAKELNARLAAQYMENKYRNRWKSRRTNELQGLSFPRAGIHDYDSILIASNAIPQELQDAQSELAIESANNVALLATLTTQTGSIKRELARVGDLVSDITYNAGQSPNPVFQLVDGLLRDLILSGFTNQRS